MKQLLKRHKLISHLLVFSLIGGVLSLGLSLILGTLEFNKYCEQAMAGDWSGALYFGPEHSGFAACQLNTPTIDWGILALELYIALFLIHIYLIFNLKNIAVKKYIISLIAIALSYLSLFYIATGLFPHLSHGFLEGWVNVSKGRFLPIPIEGIFVVGMISQLAPLIVAGLIKVNKFSLKITEGLKSFLVQLLSVACLQILIFILSFVIFINLERSKYPIQLLPDLTPKKQDNIAEFKK